MNDIVIMNSLSTGARKFLALNTDRGGWHYTERKTAAYRFATKATALEVAANEQERIGRSVIMDVDTVVPNETL